MNIMSLGCFNIPSDGFIIILNYTYTILIEVSKLSLEDEFMQYMPKNHNEERLKSLISRAIQEGVEDFYKPIIDPSLDKVKNQVYYKAGEFPAIAIDKRYEWWEKILKNSIVFICY